MKKSKRSFKSLKQFLILMCAYNNPKLPHILLEIERVHRISMYSLSRINLAKTQQAKDFWWKMHDKSDLIFLNKINEYDQELSKKL